MNAPALTLEQPARRGLTVDDFLLLNDSGAFAEYAKSELIEGEIYVVNAQFRRHAWVKRQLFLALTARLHELGSSLCAMLECSVRMGSCSMPEPDIALTSEPQGDGAIPLETVALIVEVADSSIDTDLTLKAGLYGRHDVPEYWVADVEGARLIRLTQPAGDSYARRDEFALAGPFEAATIAGLRIEQLEL